MGERNLLWGGRRDGRSYSGLRDLPGESGCWLGSSPSNRRCLRRDPAIARQRNQGPRG